jgi:DNA-binding MurR/RpiR family transcriptional regulator
MPTLVADRVRAALPDLPKAERRVAHELLASYPVAGLETVARLATRAQVSGPTVVRLVSRLGYEGFPDFQEALRSEIEERTASPLLQYERRNQSDGGDVVSRTRDVLTASLDNSLAELDRGQFSAAVDLLADTKRRLLFAGGRFSSIAAQMLAAHLGILRPGCRHLGSRDWVAYLMEVRRGDVVVIFDVRRYQRATVQFGQEAVRRGATLILVTDPWMSPLAVDADITMSVSVESASLFDSQVPTLALVEALVASTAERLGEGITRRASDYDALWEAQGFTDPGETDVPS